MPTIKSKVRSPVQSASARVEDFLTCPASPLTLTSKTMKVNYMTADEAVKLIESGDHVYI